MPISHDQIVAANEKYVETFGDKGSLPLPPGKKVAILGCMDARLNTFDALGIQEGDAHHIRNAGGDLDAGALRSLIISQNLLGTTQLILVRHTGCGMLTFTTPVAREIVKKNVPAHVHGTVDELEFLEFSDLEGSVKKDVEALKKNPLVVEGTEVSGYVYHVETGKVEKVA